MYTAARSGTTFRRALIDDDIVGAGFVNNDSSTCSDDKDCPLLVAFFGDSDLRLVCQDGSCIPGQGAYGAECLNDTHCQSGLCLRDPWTPNSRDPGACTTSCVLESSDCPGDDRCGEVGGNPRCLPGRDCLSDADCGGGANDRCLFDFNGHFSCQQLCMLDEHCPSPARCIDLAYGAGVCTEPGTTPNGGECLSPLECMGLACRGDVNELRCSTAPSNQDGGSVPDVPSIDSAVGVDRAQIDAGRDASSWPGPDGGVPDRADYASTPAPETGCSCHSATATAPKIFGLFVIVGLLMNRRRRSAF